MNKEPLTGSSYIDAEAAVPSAETVPTDGLRGAGTLAEVMGADRAEEWLEATERNRQLNLKSARLSKMFRTATSRQRIL